MAMSRLHDMRASGRDLGDLLRARAAVARDEDRGIGGERIGVVDGHLTVERIPELGDHRSRAAVRHGEDDDRSHGSCSDDADRAHAVSWRVGRCS